MITTGDHIRITYQISEHPGVMHALRLVQRATEHSFWAQLGDELVRFSQRTGCQVGEGPRQVPTHARRIPRISG